MSKKVTKTHADLPNLKMYVTTVKGRNAVLSGEVIFPLIIQPAEHLKEVMRTYTAFPEQLFGIALVEKQYDFAETLVEKEIVGCDTDVIFNCCTHPSDRSIVIAINILLATNYEPEPGRWNRELHDCLHSLFLHKEEFTPLMQTLVVMLSKFCDINALHSSSRDNLFGVMLSRKVVSVQKVGTLIDCGFRFAGSVKSNLSTATSVLDYLTHGIEIGEMIKILTLIRDSQQ